LRFCLRLARRQLVRKSGPCFQEPLVVDEAYPLVLWTPPDPDPHTPSGAADNRLATLPNAVPDDMDRLRAELAQARAEAADCKWRATHYERLFHDARAKAAAHAAEFQTQIAALKATIRQYQHEARSPKSEAHPKYPGVPPRKPTTRKRRHQPGQKQTPRRH